MSTQFSTNEAVSLEKQVDTSLKLVHTHSNQFNYTYEIDKCVQWIRKHNFKKVCLQFPDHLLADSTEVATRLQSTLQQTFYILGDTAYESCCIDYIAAAHVDADAIIHFGPVCFSKATDTIPCLRIFEKHELNIPKLTETLKCLIRDNNTSIVVDTPYIVHLPLMRDAFADCVNVNILPITDLNIDGFTIIIGNNLRKILNYKLAYGSCELYYYNPVSETCLNYAQDAAVLKRRSFLIEKIKDSQTIGIVIGTVAVRNYLTVIDRLKKLVKARGKKYYVISVGKPTVAKLANFAEIDVYVVVSCAMNEIYDSRDFYKPIVTPYDVEVALNPHSEDCKFSYDYNYYLTDSDISENVENDVSLITGKMRVNSLQQSVAESQAESSQLAVKSDGAIALNTDFGAGFLSERNWKGLEQNLGFDKPELATEGRRGIAQGYENENL